jgi:NAD(P)-dependent dehydrogenase (short-subunit alcohol dehydrogenase family)
MTLRGARTLVAGACSPSGRRLCEALLALGAHVVAADRLRTQLEELRAELRQHERLWVAECDLGAAACRALFADVARDEPIDTAILVLPNAQSIEACEHFLHAARANVAPPERGRVLLVFERDAADGAAALQGLLQRAAELPAVAGLHAAEPLGAWLERMARLADPDHPPPHGWLPP